MINNFIGGGQVFLHKVRMFRQVFSRTIYVALLIGIIAASLIHNKELKALDWQSAYSYRKAVLADGFDELMNDFRYYIGNRPNYVTFINANTKEGVWAINIDPRKIKYSYQFRKANDRAMNLVVTILFWSWIITFMVFTIVSLLWSNFGKKLKEEKAKEGDNHILTAKEVRKILHNMAKASDFVIGNMPLVKDKETQHFLVTGSTGSGKTNLIHNILPQIEQKNQPAIVIDNTGEMIAKYYNPERGDIIFNPFDARSRDWDFWTDCSNLEELERFSKILFGFNRQRSSLSSDPFWEQSAESVFNSCVEYLVNNDNLNIKALRYMVANGNVKELQKKLKDTTAARYLADDNKNVASSILSVLTTSTKPLNYLSNNSELGSFSLKKHFQNIKSGSNAWLFLATKPSSRNLTQSLIACLTELSLCQLLDIGIQEDRRVWFVIDELNSLGKLPALSTLMSEGRKYGACIICGMQSLNQLYSNYGKYEGSTIFGQFGTSFFFRNTESLIARQVSDMSGYETITRQQKNTSFGANEFRDGISYSEQQQKKLLIETSDLSSLATGRCYVFMPEPKVRIAKIQIPKSFSLNKNDSFLAKKEIQNKQNKRSESTNIDIQSPSEINENIPNNILVAEKKNKNKKQIKGKKNQGTKLENRSVETVM